MLARVLVLIALLASSDGMATPAQGIECRSSKTDTRYWSWRIIDGRRCWYPGRRKLDKSLLHWPRQPNPKDDEDVLLHSYWPPLENAR
jgi:hypothetical protein